MMKRKNIVLSVSGEHERIAEAISLHTDSLNLKVESSGWGFFKYPVHMMKGLLDRDVVMIPARNLKDYRTIYIGGPLWFGKPCPALVDMIRKSRLKGKDVVIFVTGKGVRAKIEDGLRSLVEKKGAVLKAVIMFESDGKDDVAGKLRKAGIDIVE